MNMYPAEVEDIVPRKSSFSCNYLYGLRPPQCKDKSNQIKPTVQGIAEYYGTGGAGSGLVLQCRCKVERKIHGDKQYKLFVCFKVENKNYL